MNIRGPQMFYSFFHTLDESSSYWHTVCGLELCFVVFVFNNQCFDFIYCVGSCPLIHRNYFSVFRVRARIRLG